MDFRGHLRLPDDAGTGIPVVLRLDDIYIIITSGGDELGAWRADDVTIERIFSNQFAIDLDGEPMVFVAQDALGFAYEGITAIEDLQARLTKRGLFRRKKTRAQEKAQPPVRPEPVHKTEPAARRPAAELVSHLDSEHEVAAEPQPVTSSSTPTPIWVPPVSSEPAPDREVPNVVPLPRSPSEASSGDIRVSYPRAATPSPPAVESFVPPEPAAESGPEQAAPETEAIPVESESEPFQAAAEPEQVEPEPVEVSAEPPPLESEPFFEIEEVSAAATGASWDESAASAALTEPEPEIEIEEYVPPTAGLMDTVEVASLDQSGREVEPEPEPEPEVESEPVAAIEPEPAPQPESQPELEDAVIAAAEDTGEHASNGHVRRQDKKRSFLFKRGRDKNVPAHDHAYGEPKTIGGLTRQVCEVCGHVTFSGHDVYQDW